MTNRPLMEDYRMASQHTAPGGGGSSMGRACRLHVAKCPTEAMAMTNRLVVSPRDFDQSTVHYVLVNQKYVFTLLYEHTFPSGQIGSSMLQRRWAYLSLNQEVDVEPFDPSTDGDNYVMGTLRLEVGFLRRGLEHSEHFDTEEMSRLFGQSFINQVLSIGQQIVFDFHGVNLVAVVSGIESMDLHQMTSGHASGGAAAASIHASRGMLVQETIVHFAKSPDSSIRLKGSARNYAQTLITPSFKFEDMGIGGLDDEFSAIFRRAFASRIFPPSLVEKLGIPHVKGILLFGPPGTGKTLMARQIGSMLNAQEPKIVSGPEILNKYVGQSEENIRNLFKEAEAEYKEKAEESSLHIIIFDELDAICKQRGGRSDSTGVGDSVVNQLLAKMDGVDQLNNILIIGMTNRLDMIDEALLRPGRLEVHMEIGLPDEKGRLQILKIHTSKMRENKVLEQDLDFNELATLTKNFSGAEINGLVKSAASFAFNRHVKVGTLASVAPDVESMRICREDFMAALEEVKPSFGVAEDEFDQCVLNGIIPFGDHIERILSDGQLYIEQVKNSARTPVVSVLIHGPPGSGKTALAATMAMASDFPFIKLISPESMVGYTETARVNAINKVFNDSYKSPLSVIVVDNIERLLNWVPIAARFSNDVLQTLTVLIGKHPPKGRRLLILATTSELEVLESMKMTAAFDAQIEVPTITSLAAVRAVTTELQLFDGREFDEAFRALEGVYSGHELRISVKRLLTIIEMARQDVDKVDKFVNALCSL